MITNITLENFKCFQQVSINPKLVTLFIGPNGTGKSGILQALLLLKQSRGIGDAGRLASKLRGVRQYTSWSASLIADGTAPPISCRVTGPFALGRLNRSWSSISILKIPLIQRLRPNLGTYQVRL